MVASTFASTPTPVSSAIAAENAGQAAESHLDGDVQLAADVLISPGASIFADGQRPVRVAAGVTIQD
ncbi:MAG: hypothetical protein AAGB19_15265, partial [Cyanobacteria bacterium P01_F01_bin.3]